MTVSESSTEPVTRGHGTQRRRGAVDETTTGRGNELTTILEISATVFSIKRPGFETVG